MNKVERVRAALRGGVVDHPPVTVWYHFGLQHAPAEKMAAAHLAERVRGADRPRVTPGLTVEEELRRLWSSAEPLYRQAADLSYRTDLGRDVEAEAKDLELMIRQRGL